MQAEFTNYLEKDIVDFCNGDNDALSRMYKLWLPELYLVAYRYVKNKETTEDLISDTFEKLLNMPDSKRQEKFIDKEINLKALLLVIVKNKSLDHIKTKNNRYRILKNIKFSLRKHSRNTATDYFSQESIASLLNCLPDKEQKIIELKLKGYDRNEIAKELNLAPKTVSNSLSKSRNTITQLWSSLM